jgi:PKHD-type hydroxylase
MSQQFHHIPALLKPEELTALEKLIGEANFVDGKATASMEAKEVKNNLQLDSTDSGVMTAIQKILNTAI